MKFLHFGEYNELGNKRIFLIGIIRLFLYSLYSPRQRNCLKELVSDEEKLADYLDYLHMQAIKANSEKRFDLEEIKQILALE